MNTKLTLSVDKYLIDEVKKYAKHHRTDVSSLFSNVMAAIVKQEDSNMAIEPIVKELVGIIPKKYVAEDISGIYKKHLEEKYL